MTEAELVTLSRQGDVSAWEGVVSAHQQAVFRLAYLLLGDPDDAEDVTQEILIKLTTKLSTFEGRSSFRTWLYRIAVNHILNVKRRNTKSSGGRSIVKN